MRSKSALPIGLLFARSYCRIDQDVGVEEDLNVHVWDCVAKATEAEGPTGRNAISMVVYD
jgi:hypothetical protein